MASALSKGRPFVNAHRTLTIIVVFLGFFLLAIAYLARCYHVGAMDQNQPGYQSILSQLTCAVVGRGWFYHLTLAGILMTLCLSANTSFVDFPRLSRLIARDGFLPRSFATVGRRLVYSVGIVFLAITAGGLLITFGGITDRLIPLFAVGAFLAFTLSQTGMVFHWRKELRNNSNSGGQSRGASMLPLWVNGIGAVSTGTALIIILLAKFTEGAWIVILAIPALLICFRFVHRHYEKVALPTEARRPLHLDNNPPPVVVVPVKSFDRMTEKALRFSMWISSDLFALHLHNLSGEAAEEQEKRICEQWRQDVEEPARRAGVPAPALVVEQTPYRDFLGPVFAQVDRLKERFPNRQIAVVIPEIVAVHWWQTLLHRRKAANFRKSLLKRLDHRLIVIRVPWYIED